MLLASEARRASRFRIFNNVVLPQRFSGQIIPRMRDKSTESVVHGCMVHKAQVTAACGGRTTYFSYCAFCAFNSRSPETGSVAAPTVQLAGACLDFCIAFRHAFTNPSSAP